MWGASEEPPPEIMKVESPNEVVQERDTCEQNKNQLDNLKEIMMKNKQSLKRKEEEVQEYARRLSSIKSRAKFSRKNKDGATTSTETLSPIKSELPVADLNDDVINDVSQAKTMKARSSLLQKKLEENRKVFEQRNKEITETKRVVEEKVEAMRQQLDEKLLPVIPVIPITIDSLSTNKSIDLKDQQIAELNNKILEMENIIVDLQENLKEKDSVIDSKTKAITLVSADLSKKGKTTLDTLEDTKDQMRKMQEHFVLLETSLKNKNDALLEQLKERNSKITELELVIKRNEDDIREQKLFETKNADTSRSAIEILAETKTEMTAMQENFILLESSFKSKNENLLKQLEDRETKLAEANERICNLESGIGIVPPPALEELQYKIEEIEQENKRLEDEKFNLQKTISELQNEIIASKSVKNNVISAEIKNDNQKMEEIHEESEKVLRLTKELDDLNKTMIKIKAQNRSRVKNLQKQLDDFKKVSDVNAELVRLGNQVALLEEEKGNLQLSLVDFDELKVTSSDQLERINELEVKISFHENELEMRTAAIAALENQKLDLIQELHTLKKEISTLEAENAESENLRVTAEMKIVELEEQLESLHNIHTENKFSNQVGDQSDLLKKVEELTQENSDLTSKLARIEEKGTSDTGSTESFENIQETDKTELLKKIELVTHKNSELTLKLTKLDEKSSSTADSTESFETINDTDRNELLRKIDQLTHENSELIMKLSRGDEKGSSDTGSTESFERIPEHNESMTKIELLTQENNDLVIKLYKLEEKLEHYENSRSEFVNINTEAKIRSLIEENNSFSGQLENHKTKLYELTNENTRLKSKIESLGNENNVMLSKYTNLQEICDKLKIVNKDVEDALRSQIDLYITSDHLSDEKRDIYDEITVFVENQSKRNLDLANKIIAVKLQNDLIQEKFQTVMKEKDELQAELEKVKATVENEISIGKLQGVESTELEEGAVPKSSDKIEENQEDNLYAIEQWKSKCSEMEERNLALNAENLSMEKELKKLKTENVDLIELLNTKGKAVEEQKIELENSITHLNIKLDDEIRNSINKEQEILELSKKLHEKEEELHTKYTQLQNELIAIDSLQEMIEACKLKIKDKDLHISHLSDEINKLNDQLNISNDERRFLRNREREINQQLQHSVPLKEHEDLFQKWSNSNDAVKQAHIMIDEEKIKNSEMSFQIEKMQSYIRDCEDKLKLTEDKLSEYKMANDEVEKELWEMKTDNENNKKYIDELRTELSNTYKLMEQLKVKHANDYDLQNQRLELIIEDLNIKLQENETLRIEVAEKNELLERNVASTSEIETLEIKIVDLEQALLESKKKSQEQFEKMKKIAANLKKKSIICQELEAEVDKFKKELITEKEEKNRIIQELENVVKEKDNRVIELEEKLNEVITFELNLLKENNLSLLGRINELDSEIEALRSTINQKSLQIETERQLKEKITANFESYKKEIFVQNELKQTKLEDVTEQARELTVRMHVMEKEYFEQLALINNLKAENGMLLSKQVHINEKLEIVEKESEERRMVIEKLQSQIPEYTMASTQTVDDIENENSALVQTLEAKLQERDAEIEGLNNLLVNYSNQSFQNRSVEEQYNDLQFQYNALVSNNEDVKIKLNDAEKRNEEFSANIKNFEVLNANLQEKITELETELDRTQQSSSLIKNEYESLKIGNDLMEKKISELENKLAEISASKQTVLPLELDILPTSAPKLFNASEMFGGHTSIDENLKEEIRQLQIMLKIKEDSCSVMEEEIKRLKSALIFLSCEERSRMNDETVLTKMGSVCEKARDETEKLQHILAASDYEIRELNMQLSNVTLQMTKEIDAVKALQISIHVKNQEAEDLKTELQNTRAESSELKRINEELIQSLDSCKSQISGYQAEIRLITDVVSDLEGRISSALSERDLLQLQVNDLSRSLEELRKIPSSIHTADAQVQETEVIRAEIQMMDVATPADDVTKKKSESTWETDFVKNLNEDDEGWGWNPEDAELASGQHLATSSTIIPSAEVQLSAKVDELQDLIKDFEAEKSKLTSENEALNIRNGKLVKKLKEYKVQIENLQQQLKIQKSADSFCGLDSAIEEELKSQITTLEKTLNELKDEHKQVLSDKNALSKRIENLTSVNEKYVEIKERLGIDIHVLEMKNKELSKKVDILEHKLFEIKPGYNISEIVEHEDEPNIEEISSIRSRINVDQTNSHDFQNVCKKYKDEIDDLKDEMEALAAENEQLQHVLEDQKSKLLSFENAAAEAETLKVQQESAKISENELRVQITDLKSEIEKLYLQLNFSETLVDKLKSDLQSIEVEKLALEEKLIVLQNAEEEKLSISSSLAEVTELLNARVQEVAELKQQLQKQYIVQQDLQAKSDEVVRHLESELEYKQQMLSKLQFETSQKDNELTEQNSSETGNTIINQTTQELLQKHAFEIEERDVQLHHLADQVATVQHTAERYSLALQEKSVLISDLQEEIMRLNKVLVEKELLVNTEKERYEANITEKQFAVDFYYQEHLRLQSLLREKMNTATNVDKEVSKLEALKNEIIALKNSLGERDEVIQRYDSELTRYKTELETNRVESERVRCDLIREMGLVKDELQEKIVEIQQLRTELNELRNELDLKKSEFFKVVDSIPVSTMSGEEESEDLTKKLKAEMVEKQKEIEHLKFVLSENTYPRIIQEMQGTINCLYNEKAHLELTLRNVQYELDDERAKLENMNQHERRSIQDQDEIARLQNLIHEKEQEINELKYVIAEKDSQLSLQASMEPQVDDYELRESMQSLTNELYSKEQEIQEYKLVIGNLQNETLRLNEFEKLTEENRRIIESLTSEKESIRLEAEQLLETRLTEKEAEINDLKERLYAENQRLMEDLQLRNNEVEELRRQLKQAFSNFNEKLRVKEEELYAINDEIGRRERNLHELTVTKDVELHNLQMQINEKDVRIKELTALSEEEGKQLAEMRETIEARELEIKNLKDQLEEKIQEYEVIRQALKKDISLLDTEAARNQSSTSSGESAQEPSNEMNLALYMLHQRDVRCEELTHELMQLLEERDTLQLRLSNAIKINEELKKMGTVKPKDSEAEPCSSDTSSIEQASSSKSDEPVETAIEAINTSLGEDKEALAEKLSQLHSVGHKRDVRLKDEQELRHTQQMSLLAHKDVLSKLPPEAAARLVNANYTLSRDTQSQSSVLLNWLWGKSTPKVVHM